MQQVLSKWNRNEKGFTLVELLAVIVILGIILAIAIPAIGSIINKAETDTDGNQEELIFSAAKLAEANGDLTLGTTDVQDLIDNGYLEDRDSLEGYYDRIISENTAADSKEPFVLSP